MEVIAESYCILPKLLGRGKRYANYDATSGICKGGDDLGKGLFQDIES